MNAHQWHRNGDHPLDYASDELGIQNGEPHVFPGAQRRALGWEGGVVRRFRHPDFEGTRRCAHCERSMHEHGWIDAGVRAAVVCPGDWIVTDESGNHHPVKPGVYGLMTLRPLSSAPVDTWVILATSGGHVGEAISAEADGCRWRWAGAINLMHESLKPLGWMPLPPPTDVEVPG